MTKQNIDIGMKMKIKPFYNTHHFTRRDRSLKAGPVLSLLLLTLGPNELAHFFQYAQNTL